MGEIEMDADETLSRLFRQRRYLLVLAILLGVTAFLVVQRQAHPTYRADARLVLGPELNSSQEAQSVVSRARAIATSEKVLVTAVGNAKVARTADQLNRETSLTGISDSGLARLSVTDRDPAVAAALCRALAAATTDFINTTNSQPMKSTLESIDAQLKDAVSQYQQAESTASGGSTAVQAQLAAINENINALSTARGQLLARQALDVPAGVVDQPPALGERTSSNTGTIAGLAVVGGLLLWLLAAAVVESFRPTLPTLRSVGRHFDAPALGSVRADLALDDARTAEAIDRLILSAQHLRADTLVVGGDAGPSAQFVATLDALLKARMPTGGFSLPCDDARLPGELALPLAAGAPGTGALGTKPDEPSIPVARNGRAPKAAPTPRHALPLDLAHVAPSRGTGLLVVASPGARKAEMREIEELVRCSYWPVIGVIEVVKASPRERNSNDADDVTDATSGASR